MELIEPTMQILFAQLGEPDDPQSIEHFIERHGHLSSAVALHQAPFWSAAQARFLCNALRQDANWAPVVDELNTRLHEDGMAAAAQCAALKSPQAGTQ